LIPHTKKLKAKEESNNFKRDTDWDIDTNYINEEQGDQEEQQTSISLENISQLLPPMDRRRK